jgi:hypothetical protein
MIHKTIILYDSKLLYNKFSINKKDNKIIIKSLDIKEDIIKVPVYNKYNGIDYIPVCFPIEYIIIENNVFNPYLIFTSYNIQNNNNVDFFNGINQCIIIEFKLNIMNLNKLLDDSKINLIKILNDNYSINLNMNNIITEIQNLKSSELMINRNIFLFDFIKKFWFNLNIIKLYVICTLIKYPNKITTNLNIPKNLQNIINNLKKFKYSLTNNKSEYYMSLNEYVVHKFNTPLKLSDLKKNNNYFIIIGGQCNSTDIITTDTSTNSSIITKIVQVNINKITKNIININNKNLIFENYKWYYYYPNININKNFILYQTYINYNFTNEIIKDIIGLNDIHIIKYYMNDNKLNNLIILSNVFTELKIYMDDINILKSNSYDSEYFEYITKKYSDNDEKLFEILEILFSNYTYPLKNNHYNIDPIFDYIMYISMYNYKKILINNKNIIIKFNEMLHPRINNIIPFKVKNLYINFLKIIQNLLCKEYDLIIYNQKFYIDTLHKNIIKLLLGDNTCLISRLFKEMIPINVYNRFKEIIKNNILLLDISNKLSWKTLPKKLYYIKFFYINSDIIFYQQKLNKNIIPDNFDIKIKKVIENPFEMYQYIKKEKDFIKWTRFISDKIINLYYIPISISSEDFDNIGKLLYLLFNINEQKLNDPTYVEFIKFCNLYNKLILDSTRINLKIKEYFQNIKFNINLGFLAKHLTTEIEILTFDNNIIKTDEVIILENKINEINKKYNKYKIKYLQSKSSNLELNVCNSDIFSETSKY